ncbi:fatty-acid amide hydrolase 2-like [Pollicipes pollicipes]|uniref:fatty-acid amide hydrolase 2-like n=1 Tax=Pollicipes pollicipes TaxID=41117 RepID=UPI00188522EC|nr:fatty-acid amide hydrolase 2-like [Pollicipes pollicipes]XP_037091610.1 fatty-acid amide hydrolase 2-like [Pollicipes pollicipes]XP_037092042.1 fatty-acid amide hydrolase 2-like [Pollicipes pollicipes]XP_037092043.1 fatty-acid amide hydrolase 2-like [Pollicipes pollicipes]
MSLGSGADKSGPAMVRYSTGQIWIGRLLKVVYRLLGLFSDLVFGLAYNNRTEPLPPIRNMVLLESGVSLARMIRKGKLKSEEVVRSFMERIREVNPILNCVTEDRFEEALAEARGVDKLVASGERSEAELERDTPFLGVPFTAKDSIAIRGLKHTAGLWARRHCVADEDAAVVRQLRKAGAIPLAHTNVPELCMWWETSNKIYGRSCNPYVTTRITGGSSGGEAALLAAAGSPFGLGSDIGGSIRMPCFFNGIFGHKPTAGVVCNAGQLPLATGELDTFLVTGPMCRHAGDLLPLYRVLAAPNLHLLALDRRASPSQLRFFIMEDDGGFPLSSPVHADVRGGLQRAARLLEGAHGVRVRPLRLRALFHQLEIWAHKMGSVTEAPSFAAELRERCGAVRPGWELFKWCLMLSDHTLPALLLALTERRLPADTESSRDFLRMCEALKAEFEATLGDDGVLLYPSHPTPAPYHLQPLFKGFNFAYTSIFNVLELPVSQVPLGLGSWGVPVGAQVVAARGRDHLTLAVAEELERLAGGWVCPSKIE